MFKNQVESRVRRRVVSLPSFERQFDAYKSIDNRNLLSIFLLQ